jgi:vancomycin permeability regulator SanA
MLGEKTTYHINRAVELARTEGVTFIVLAMKPETQETALISSLNEALAKSCMRVFLEANQEMKASN